MRKNFFSIIIVILLPILLLSFTGCKSKLQIARDVGQDIMNAFIAKDEDALYSLLSPNAKNSPNIREQIQEAFDFIDGEIVSYELPTDTGGGGRAMERGKVTHENITPWIDYIKTDSTEEKKHYRLQFRYDLVFKDDKNSEGLSNIIVSLLDENRSLIERTAIGLDFDEEDRFPR